MNERHAAIRELEERAARPDGGMGKKPSNPKDVVGIKKVPRSVLPLPVLWELGLAMLEGALKYGRHNYRAVGVRASVYYDAANRHLDAWWEGEDFDPDSQLSHVCKAIASLVVLRDGMIRGNWVDDRPPRSQPGIMGQLNNHVELLLKKYPDPVAPWTQLMLQDAKADAVPKSVEHPGHAHAQNRQKDLP